MKYHPIDDPEYFRNRDYIGQPIGIENYQIIRQFLILRTAKSVGDIHFLRLLLAKILKNFTKYYGCLRH